ncbi:MAG: hypothetical protein KGM47_12020 [Acidobacteriota bacterium]|nr:hypothetical protein [Acidobacteriota bacterium]
MKAYTQTCSNQLTSTRGMLIEEWKMLRAVRGGLLEESGAHARVAYMPCAGFE